MTTTVNIVPVSCPNCQADMRFTITTLDTERRVWTLDCPECGYHEQTEFQRRHHLWVHDVDYVGSYWGPDV